MTLRRYFLDNCIEENAEIFANEFEALYAEGWDAEFFAKKVFKKELNEVKFRDMYIAFKGAARSISPLSLEELDTDYTPIVDGNKMALGTGTYRKLKFTYSDNYEPNFDEE